MTMLKQYKGYNAKVEIDLEDQVFTGTVLDLHDILHFEAHDFSEIQPAFEQVVDEYLAWCEETGTEPDKPYSGKFLLRMPSTLHRQLARRADNRQESLNSFIVTQLAKALGEDYSS